MTGRTSPVILILGASGMLGRRLGPWLKSKGYEVLTQSRTPGHDLCLDPVSVPALLEAIQAHSPDVIINLTAKTNVDACEREPEDADRANVAPAKALASALKMAKAQAHIVHVSTDQVYNGLGYQDEDSACGINVYARTKLQAESLILESGGTVLRTNFVGASLHPLRQSLSDWLISNMHQAHPIDVFDNIWFNPLHQITLCDLIARVIEKRPPGVFNAASADGCSKADFAYALAKGLKLPTQSLRRRPYRPDPQSAKRPHDMRMSPLRLANAIRWTPPTMAHEIDLIAQESHA